MWCIYNKEYRKSTTSTLLDNGHSFILEEINLTPQENRHLIVMVVGGFGCLGDPGSYVVRGNSPLQGLPRQSGPRGGARLRVSQRPS